MPEDYIECKSSTVISINFLLAYSLQVYLDHCICKIVNKKMTDYFDENVLKIRHYKCCITIELI